MAGGRDDMPWWVQLLMIIGVLLEVLIVGVLLTGQGLDARASHT